MITVTSLRKIFTEQGIKGASKWTRLEFDTAILTDWFAADEEDATRNPAAPEFELAAAPKKGICEDCGRKVGNSGHPTLCTPCFDYAGWENTHGDNAHEGNGAASEAEEIAECPVCHPELDTRTARKTGRSRLGMVIVAKGTEIHKSETFRVAAEAAGWIVTVHAEDYSDGTDEGATRYYADAHRNGDAVQLAWDGRRYDYPSSSARIAGKDRKVRNLKEALRLLAA